MLALPPPPEPGHDAVRCYESLLAEPLPAGFLALGEPFFGGDDEFGLGLGLGQVDDIGTPSWLPFCGDGGGSDQDGAWRVTGDDGGDCFDWPDLAIGNNMH